jgi:hypothetical protein
MGVVNPHQCSNCDLHLAGDNLTKIVAGFCRVFLVMKDNDERMWSIYWPSEHRLKGGRNANEQI